MATWPFSPFARPTSSFNLPVPPPVPAGGVCNSLVVTYPAEWQPYILSALAQLTLQTTWQGDQAAIALAQEQAWSIIRDIQQAICETSPELSGGCDCGGCMGSCGNLEFRNGVLGCDCCGTFIPVPGQGGGQGPQPGAGSPQPTPGGGTSDYCFTLPGTSGRILPTLVSSGDTLLIEDPNGAWYDGPLVGANWRCPSGRLFILGGCVDNYDFNALNPIPSAPDMGLIASIGGTYYDVYNRDSSGNPQLFTVPPGITNAQVVFQANDHDPHLDGGEITFCVRVTNNAPVPWSHTLDFTSSPFGFQDASTGTSFAWTAGVGWQAAGGIGVSPRLLFTAPSTEWTRAKATFLDSAATFNPSSAEGIGIPAGTYVAFVSPITSSPQTLDSGPISVTATTIRLDMDDANGPLTFTITSLHVEGIGADPFPGAPIP